MSEPPGWLDALFLQQSLRLAEPDTAELSVAGVSVRRMEAANYVFELQAEVHRGGQDKQRLALVVKVEQGDEERREAFRREEFTYHEVLPALEDALRAAEAPSSFTPLSPRCLPSAATVLLLEDLRSAGYLPPRCSPLDVSHCSLVLRAAARLHAASLHLKPQNSGLYHHSGFFGEHHRTTMQRFTERNMLAVADVLDRVPGFAGWAQKYRQLAVKIVGRLAEVGSRRAGFSVLLHGDLWKNNLLFRYTDDAPVDVRLIDFQMCYVGSPAQDLLFFLYGNASLEVHRDHLDTLLAEYHSTLVATLRALGMHDAADEYPLEQLNKDIDDHLLLGLYCACNAMCFTLATQDYNRRDEEEIFGNPALLSYIKYVTPLFESKGLL